ncbi:MULTISPECIES: hypothetical protein [Enterococcus]|uniref:hypothetical protein n=1 Tax=Enterococcus TaxID=1350 RepID=UPI0008A56673|nr:MULTISPECIES: hypothetical protein [unclassified Enterococcus]OFT89516.1 hypothetical protein HMPREF3100_03170 [Enterococcus sp. HMSC29A04]OFU62076.1 hypothetical protein HMPREF3128_14065 [Enterococcus sp. HMSC14A10]DAH55909.1 MAG TPA: hypothetical protein [Caudoviricetes sp.]
MKKIDPKKVQAFIEREANEELTPQEEMRKFQSLKLSILEQVEKYLKRALETNDSAMVAAIAEIVKAIN